MNEKNRRRVTGSGLKSQSQRKLLNLIIEGKKFQLIKERCQIAKENRKTMRGVVSCRLIENVFPDSKMEKTNYFFLKKKLNFCKKVFDQEYKYKNIYFILVG